MIIESEAGSDGLGIEYHARQIRDAIEEAHNDGYFLDNANEKEIVDLDLNSKTDSDSYVRIIRGGVLIRAMKEA